MAVAGMNMNMSNPKDEMMMNLTMNAMMIGITMNGSVDCFREAGQVIRETGMNMTYFSGPGKLKSRLNQFCRNLWTYHSWII